MRTLLRGGTAGALASAAMGLVMLAGRKLGVAPKLAPEHVTEAGLDTAEVDRREETEDAASTLGHLAYGAGNGALFALVASRLPGRPVVRGLTYATVLLLISYEGWIPAARILPPLHAQTPAGRRTLIVGHAVYGAVLGRLAADDGRRRPTH